MFCKFSLRVLSQATNRDLQTVTGCGLWNLDSGASPSPACHPACADLILRAKGPGRGKLPTVGAQNCCPAAADLTPSPTQPQKSQH